MPTPPRSRVRGAIAGAVFCGLAAALVPATAADGDPGALRGIARGDGGPAADAEIAAGILGWAPAAGDHVALARTDAEGRFALERAPLGPIDVWVRPKGGKWTFVLRMAHPGPNDLQVDARARRGMGDFGMGREGSATVSGVVTDLQAKPIAGAAVGLRGDDTTWVVTDAKGQFTLTGAAEGDGIVARANGYRDALAEVKLAKKKVTLKLKPAVPTVVHVTDADGRPVAAAWVVLGDPERVLGTTGFTSMFPPRERLVGGWTDANGDARIAWGHTEDETVATAYSPRHAPASKPITAGKAPVNLQLTPMRPARATVVRRGGSEPLAGVYVGLPHESDGGPDSISALPEDAQRGPIVVGRTDEQGTCLVPHLADGVDTLRVVGEHQRDADVRIERVAAGAGK